MTLHEVTSYLFNTSLGHFINGEKFTRNELQTYIKRMTRPEVHKTMIIEVCLPDGRWLAEVTQFAPEEYDWYIPETREQEQRLWDRLTGKAGR